MNNSTLKLVDHTYRDFSTYLNDGGKPYKHKKCHKNFPAQLHRILSDPENSEVVTWMPHGRAFKVLNKDVFVTSVISKYTTCTKYESFTRQLNSWGFKRLYQTGPDQGCYYHECFLRGLPKLTTLITRLPPNMGKTTPYPVGEPNFYLLSEQFPLPLSSSSSSSTDNPSANSSTSDRTSNMSTSTHQTRHDKEQHIGDGQNLSSTQELTSGFSEKRLQSPDHSRTVPLTQETISSSLAKYGSIEPLPLHAQHYQRHTAPPDAVAAGSSSALFASTAPTPHQFPHQPHAWACSYPLPVHDGQPNRFAHPPPPSHLPTPHDFLGVAPLSAGYHQLDYPVNHVPHPTVHRPFLPPPPHCYPYYEQPPLYDHFQPSHPSSIYNHLDPSVPSSSHHVPPPHQQTNLHDASNTYMSSCTDQAPPPTTTWEMYHNNEKKEH